MIKKITKEDFKAWLDDPCTKFFCTLIEKDRNELKEGCTDSLYANFNKASSLAEIASKTFGICKGLDRILDFINESREQVLEERENELKRPEDRQKVEDCIGNNISFVYGGYNENN